MRNPIEVGKWLACLGVVTSMLGHCCWFAEFIEGAPHITEEEILDYSHWDTPETDDEDGR